MKGTSLVFHFFRILGNVAILGISNFYPPQEEVRNREILSIPASKMGRSAA